VSFSDEVQFARDTRVVLIPDGVDFRIPAGATGWVRQVLGGNFTVMLDSGRLVRVAAADADAIGRTSEVAAEPAAPGERADADGVWNVLRTIYDPEIPHNVVDLGLVYELSLREVDGGVAVDVVMTLTAPGCGMGPVLVRDVEDRVGALPGVQGVSVELVFEPPWSPERMTEEIRTELGMW
jgi:probable FeS assembly SUF system protein SufT